MKYCPICERSLDKGSRHVILLGKNGWLRFCSDKCKREYLDYTQDKGIDLFDEINKPLKDKFRDIEEFMQDE